MSWIFLSIAAAFLWAFCNIIDKYVLSKLVVRPVVPIIISAIVGILLSLVIFLKVGLAPLSAPLILLALFSGAIGSFWLFLYFKAVTQGEISRIVPVMYLAPVFIAIFAWAFLGETLALGEYLGISLLIAGALLISLELPFSLRLNNIFWLMLLATFLGAINQIIQKYLLGFSDFWTIFAYARIGFFLAMIPAIFLYFSDLVSTYKEKGVSSISLMAVNDLINCLGILIFTLATAIGLVTLTNAIASAQPFFVLLIATLLGVFYPKILKEEIGKSTLFLKLASIAIMFIGGLLIS